MPKSYENAVCPRCGKLFLQLVVTVLGHRVYEAKCCQECLPKDAETEEADQRRQTNLPL